MKFDILFEERVLVAEKLKACIRDFGYTKCSFAGLTNISRPTLDKLLSGSIDNKSSFDKHLKKVLSLLDMTGEELLFYSASPVGRSVDVVYESAVKTKNETLKRAVETHFDDKLVGIAERFDTLGVDNTLVKPSYIVDVSVLRSKIKRCMRECPELDYHRDNELFLDNIIREVKLVTGEKYA